MDSGFFRSKYFIIAATVGVALLAGAASAYFLADSPAFFSTRRVPCDAPAPGGAALAATPSETSEPGRRTVTYAIDAAEYVGGSLDLCVGVGDIVVEPSSSSALELEFVITGDHQGAIDATKVAAAFGASDGRIHVGAAQTELGMSGGPFDADGADVRLVVRVPQVGPFDVAADVDVGDVHAEALLVDALSLATDVGNVVAKGIDLQGDATARADVGNVELSLASVQSGNVTARADVGDALVQLPLRADVGYDARAQTDVGEAVIRIGDTEAYESEASGPGESESARSTGFAQKPTRVSVVARTDVGDAHITAS